MPKTRTEKVSVERVTHAQRLEEPDELAVEEPLEIRVGFRDGEIFRHKPISITMRTPGNDFELATGFLFTEGILTTPNQVKKVHHCGPKGEEGETNTVRVDLEDDVAIDFDKLDRHFYTTSSCGVCGKSSIEALSVGVEGARPDSGTTWDSDFIYGLPERLETSQDVFERTGGLHASALFNPNGKIDMVREDVGRHNALDKVIGAKFLDGSTVLSETLLLLSGRISFELVQKALVAGIRTIVAVGSPSSLAVELAGEYDMTLVGFARDNRFNVYTGKERIK